MLFAALTTETFADGASVINEGEPGSKFYIIKNGHAIVSKANGTALLAESWENLSFLSI